MSESETNPPGDRVDLEQVLALAEKAQSGKLDSTAKLAAEEIKDREHNRGLRGGVSHQLIWILSGELIFLGVLILLQGFKPGGFGLEQWVFSIFTTSVLAQTFFLVRLVIKDLFPARHR